MTNTTDKQILTAAGKALLAQLNAEEKALVIDKMIFANVPNRPEYPQPDDVVPSENVNHEAAVEQRGRLSVDSVIYSTTLASNEGPFDFNWTGTYCSEYGVLVTIDHHALTPKAADKPGVTGNTLVRSMVLEYKDIAAITNITIDASSWQYNANPRMKKMDRDTAQAIIDQNGKDWFIEDGFQVTPQSNAFNIKAGAGYVSGNRITLEFERNIQVLNKPSFIYVNAHREGSSTGEQVALFDFMVTAEEKDDYTDGNGVKHFVCKIAQVLADGSVVDLREKNKVVDLELKLENDLKVTKTGQYVIANLTDPENPNIKIQYNYAPNEDRWIELECCGVNGIFSFSALHKNTYNNVDKRPRGDFLKSELVQQFQTDLIAPIIMRAEDNPDGDTDATAFTGGWHGYNGDQTGAPTANHKSLVLFIDGKQLDASEPYSGYCETISIKSSSGIQGYNTKKADGTGRNILEQEIYWVFKEGKCEVFLRLIPLETVTFIRYYGLQTAFVGSEGMYDDASILFVGGENNVRNPASLTANSGDYATYKCNRMSLKNSSGDSIQVWIDGGYGIGTREYLPAGKWGAFTGAIKSYFLLFTENPFTMEKGKALELHGGFAWEKGENVSAADLHIKMNRNGDIYNVIDFINAGTQIQYAPVDDYFSVSKPVAELIKDPTINGFENKWWFYTVSAEGAGEYWYKH